MDSQVGLDICITNQLIEDYLKRNINLFPKSYPEFSKESKVILNALRMGKRPKYEDSFANIQLRKKGLHEVLLEYMKLKEEETRKQKFVNYFHDSKASTALLLRLYDVLEGHRRVSLLDRQLSIKNNEKVQIERENKFNLEKPTISDENQGKLLIEQGQILIEQGLALLNSQKNFAVANKIYQGDSNAFKSDAINPLKTPPSHKKRKLEPPKKNVNTTIDVLGGISSKPPPAPLIDCFTNNQFPHELAKTINDSLLKNQGQNTEDLLKSVLNENSLDDFLSQFSRAPNNDHEIDSFLNKIVYDE